MGPFREIRMKKTALDGLNWMIQPPCLLMRLRDYFKIKDKIRTKIRTKKTAPAGRTTRRMDFNPETLSFKDNSRIIVDSCICKEPSSGSAWASAEENAFYKYTSGVD